MNKVKTPILLPLSILVAIIFAIKAYFLIDMTSLWKDELSTIYKSFILSIDELFYYLKSDVHPPLYYLIIKFIGVFLPKTSFTLRFISWLFYILGGCTITIFTYYLSKYRKYNRKIIATSISIIIVFCTPFPLRFSIEGKSYSLLILLICIVLFYRSIIILENNLAIEKKFKLIGYFLALSLVSFIHYYGLFYAISIFLVDLLILRIPILITIELISFTPILIWLSHKYITLINASGISWITSPNYNLFEDILENYLGPLPIPKILFFVLFFSFYYLIGYWKFDVPKNKKLISVFNLSGLFPSTIMIFMVLIISFYKPIAFSRYFLIILPSLSVASSIWISSVNIVKERFKIILATFIMAILIIYWNDSFIKINPTGNLYGSREGEDYRTISLNTSKYNLRFTIDEKLHYLNSSDFALIESGKLPFNIKKWNSIKYIYPLLEFNKLKSDSVDFIIAATGNNKKLKDLSKIVKEVINKGYSCEINELSNNLLAIYKCK